MDPDLTQALKYFRTTPNDPVFVALVKELDKELAVIDGDDHPFYAQFNGIDILKYAVIAYHDNEPVGCGAMKILSNDIAEIKRMYTHPAFRGKGIGAGILGALESWALEAVFNSCVLETGIRQPDAIRLYEKCGYHRIPNYGPYAGKTTSVCFKKLLSDRNT